MRNVVLIFITFAAVGFTQTSIQQMDTGQMSNGRAWEIFNEPERVAFLTAIKDQLLYDFFTSDNGIAQLRAAQLRANWAEGFTVGDYLNELNVLYKDRENIRIPIVMAFRYCTQKLKGQSSKQELENRLLEMRKTVSALR
jgi:hypothetical protein